MANLIIPYIRPVADFFNSICVDQHQKQLFENRGHTGSLGADWTSKYLRSEQDVYNHQYLEWHRKFTEDPELVDVVSDNAARLTIFAGVERALAIRQAQAILKTQYQGVTQSFAGAAQSVFNAGTFRGYFRGALLNFLQFVGAPYQSLVWSRNAGVAKQIGVSSFFELFLYPLDTIKSNIYCDTLGKYKGALDCAQKLLQNGGLVRLYQGVGHKIVFNAALVYHLNNVYEGSAQQWISMAVLAAAYPILVAKTRLQVASTPISLATLSQVKDVRSSFAGLTPFLIFNTVFAYQFAAWYSPEAQNKVVSHLKDNLKQFVSPGAEHVWSS